MRRWVRSDKGSILIMMAAAMAVLAGFGILTIDIGRMLVTRTQLQNGADAGALAGAAMFCNGAPPDDGTVMARAELIAEANKALEIGAEDIDILPGDIVVEHSANAHDVIVTTRSDTRQYLTGLFAIFQNSDPDVPDPVGTSNVRAIAAARCGGTCSVNCVKPWSIPDRWDDVNGVTGYTGGPPARRDWRNNGQYDFEAFVDANANKLYDPGEGFTDRNANGRYDEEPYHPMLTGYGPDPVPGNILSPSGDLGLELTLHAGRPSDTPAPGQYYSVDLPPINKMIPAGSRPPSGANEYRWNIANCNSSMIEKGDWLMLKPGGMVGPTRQGMDELIAKDPNAEWDDATQSVINSAFPVSPRIVLIPLYDPHIAIDSGRNTIQVIKVAAFFMEEVSNRAEVRGKFLKVRAPGAPCPDGQSQGFFVYNLSLIR